MFSESTTTHHSPTPSVWVPMFCPVQQQKAQTSLSFLSVGQSKLNLSKLQCFSVQCLCLTPEKEDVLVLIHFWCSMNWLERNRKKALADFQMRTNGPPWVSFQWFDVKSMQLKMTVVNWWIFALLSRTEQTSKTLRWLPPNKIWVVSTLALALRQIEAVRNLKSDPAFVE